MTNETDKSGEDDDRRAFFRIDDAIRLSIRKMPNEDVQERIERLEKDLVSNFTVMSSLAAISSEMAVNMRRIEHKEPDIGAYLKAIDRKIEVLGRAFLTQESELVAEPAREVNLSAGGVSMLVNEKYEDNQVVELKMLLFPSFTGVITYGTVIDCVPTDNVVKDGGFDHKMRIEFTYMRDQDRDVLIRHILRCQSNDLRNRNPT